LKGLPDQIGSGERLGETMTNVTPFRAKIVQPQMPVETDQAVPAASHNVNTSRTFHFWTGASHRRYVHIVHNLLECPELPATNYLLVHVSANGTRTPLRIARAESTHGSENLAEIRSHAARLGATEVHLHVLADTSHARAIVQWDLQAACFGDLDAEGVADDYRKSVGV